MPLPVTLAKARVQLRKRTGHFWQGHFGCAAMHGTLAEAAIRHVLLNPVRARLAERPEAPDK